MSWWILLLVWLFSPRHTERRQSALLAAASAAVSITGARWAWRKANWLFPAASRLASCVAAIPVWISVWVWACRLVWALSTEAVRFCLGGSLQQFAEEAVQTQRRSLSHLAQAHLIRGRPLRLREV